MPLIKQMKNEEIITECCTFNINAVLVLSEETIGINKSQAFFFYISKEPLL
jgi:hypothetical protein